MQDNTRIQRLRKQLLDDINAAQLPAAVLCLIVEELHRALQANLQEALEAEAADAETPEEDAENG